MPVHHILVGVCAPKLGHREDYPRLLRGDAAPAGPGGPGLPKEQDERRQV